MPNLLSYGMGLSLARPACITSERQRKMISLAWDQQKTKESE
jgi:hypothetical protein